MISQLINLRAGVALACKILSGYKRARANTHTHTHTHAHVQTRRHTHNIATYILPSLIIDWLYIYPIYINISILLSANPVSSTFVSVYKGLLKLIFSKHSNIIFGITLLNSKQPKKGKKDMGLVITDGYITISHGLFVSLNLVISPHFPSYKIAHRHNS